ncbi:uncharacterized protein LOC120432024 isoform X2 [Culex pipiens pallens]|uniref:uncharacterized protein LOC120413270 isoform X2 n=1 Tax=Culex pipiens pallens TaxID=42434 RepID=UPI001952A086|nr:uncharacterized protein LOC120413270 isoform X2 [Culex pipiens pallens]XP_039433118.1 uncharacterized protein LOC120415590 isoform X2 [Culex pipiens pallens]XP_039448630.1 uncharacterized protein LOC120427775 isoform X2 [Culex pipiens pallens]XP_039451066.1 uncharacterized protein LOC120430036 isoform X2 [Culex pipiens pallens]XP_039453095.1 uncharacterized protein LOC120432024 isoform X2 [Culex pipiens pallens]
MAEPLLQQQQMFVMEAFATVRSYLITGHGSLINEMKNSKQINPESPVDKRYRRTD